MSRKLKPLIRKIDKSKYMHQCLDCDETTISKNKQQCHYCFESFVDIVAGHNVTKIRDKKGVLIEAFTDFN